MLLVGHGQPNKGAQVCEAAAEASTPPLPSVSVIPPIPQRQKQIGRAKGRRRVGERLSRNYRHFEMVNLHGTSVIKLDLFNLPPAPVGVMQSNKYPL